MKIAAVSAAALCLLGACSKAPETTAAVREGIIKDLGKRMDVNTMDVNVSSVSFRGSQADATVSFNAKGQPNAAMQMKYTLEKKDDGWHIMRRQGDAAAHGGPLTAPPGEGGQREMPANHPPIP